MQNIKDIIFGSRTILVQALIFLIFFIYFGLKVTKSIINDVQTYNNQVMLSTKSCISFSKIVEISVKEDGETIKTFTLPIESAVKIIVVKDVYRNSGKILDITVFSTKKY
jgi:hypothetical protein